MFLGCLVGPIVGALVGVLFIWLVFMPLEARYDPEGFNYAAVYEILSILGIFTVFGCIGGFIAHNRLRNRDLKQRPSYRDQEPPDDETWPPPPNLPAA